MKTNKQTYAQAEECLAFLYRLLRIVVKETRQLTKVKSKQTFKRKEHDELVFKV